MSQQKDGHVSALSVTSRRSAGVRWTEGAGSSKVLLYQAHFTELVLVLLTPVLGQFSAVNFLQSVFPGVSGSSFQTFYSFILYFLGVGFIGKLMDIGKHFLDFKHNCFVQRCAK